MDKRKIIFRKEISETHLRKNKNISSKLKILWILTRILSFQAKVKELNSTTEVKAMHFPGEVSATFKL